MQFPTSITPDTTTRAGRMLEAGDVRVTVTSEDTDTHITLRFKAFGDNRQREVRPDVNKNWVRVPFAEASHVFIEVPTPDGEWADKVGTFYPKSQRWFKDDNCDPDREFAAIQAARWLDGDRSGSYGLRFQEESRCGVCSRTLTDPVSIDRGIGPECFGKQTGSQHQVKDTAQKVREERAADPEVHTGAMAQEREQGTGEVADGRGGFVGGDADDQKEISLEEARDQNMHDMAEVELGIDTSTLTPRQLSIMLHAAIEQQQMNAARAAMGNGSSKDALRR